MFVFCSDRIAGDGGALENSNSFKKKMQSTENIDGGIMPPSTLMATPGINNPTWSRQQAVSVRHAFKTYGSSKNPNHVIQNLSMTVAKGSM